MSGVSLKVRVATPEDLSVVLAWTQAFYNEEHLQFDPVATPRAVSVLLDNPACGAVLLFGTDAPVGYAALTRGFSLEQRGHYALLDELYIAPHARGRGLAAHALDAAADQARAWGVSMLRLEVLHHNPRAKALYLRAGFVDDRRDMLRLELGTAR